MTGDERLSDDPARRLAVHRAQQGYQLTSRLFSFCTTTAFFVVALAGWSFGTGSSDGGWASLLGAALLGGGGLIFWHTRDRYAAELIENEASPVDVSLLPPAVAAAVVSGVFTVIGAMIKG